MSNLFTQFKSDPELEKSGIVLLYGKNSKNQNIEFKIARAGGSNTQYLKALDIESKPYRRLIQNETMDRDVGQEIMRKVFAKAVLKGWSGVEDENGESIEFSVANAIKLFEDLPDLFNDIQEQAQKGALYRADIRELEAKN